jgi:hypothetical protein
MSIYLDIIAVGIIISSLLVVGEYLDRKVKFYSGVGSILVYFLTQVSFSFLALNPFSSKNLWAIQSILVWGALAGVSSVILVQKRHQSKWIREISTLVTIGIGLLLFLQPGERTWDGAGYHNPISLLVYQSGHYWDWPNLMWAQWFPAGQETIAASFLVIFSNYNGLIVPTILWSVLSINLIINVIREGGVKRWTKTVSVLFATTIPFLLPQTGTSYVDIQMGIAFMLVCYFLTLPSNGWLEKGSLFIVSAGLMASKWSGVALLLIAFLFSLTFKKVSIRHRFVEVFVMASGSVVGIFPIAFRNFIEFTSPTYPFKGPFNIWGGLFPQSLMTKQIGNANQPPGYDSLDSFGKAFDSYILSIFDFWQQLGVNFLEHGFNFRVFDSRLLNYISYDARLGGFGLVFTALIFLVFCLRRSMPSYLARYLLLLVPLVAFPMNWWARYFVGIAFALILIESKGLIQYILKKRIHLKIAMSVLIMSSTASGFSFVLFNQFQKTNWPSQTGYGEKVSALLSSDCGDVFVIGEGLTFSSSLWGQNKCNRVVGSIHFGNAQESIGQFGSIPTGSENNIISELKPYLKRFRPLKVVITYPEGDAPVWAIELVDQLRSFRSLSDVVLSSESNGHPVLVFQIN